MSNSHAALKVDVVSSAIVLVVYKQEHSYSWIYEMCITKYLLLFSTQDKHNDGVCIGEENHTPNDVR